METTQIFCVYYALAFHSTPFQSLPHIVMEWFLQNASLVIISPLTKIFDGSLFFHTGQNVMESTSQTDPSLPLQSRVTHQHTLSHFPHYAKPFTA